MSLAERLARVPWSGGLAFTPDGRGHARLTDRSGALTVEVADATGWRRVYGPAPELSADTQLSFDSTGRLRICGWHDGRWLLVEACRNGSGAPERTWAARTVAEVEADLLRLLPPSGAAPSLAVSATEEASTLWRLEPGGPPRAVAELPGRVDGGAWLDPPRPPALPERTLGHGGRTVRRSPAGDSGRRTVRKATLAVNLRAPGGKASGYLVDLWARTYHRVFHLHDDSDDRIAWCDARRGLLAVTSDRFGHRCAGVATLTHQGKVRFVPEPPGEDRPVDVCGHTADGRLVLRRQHGIRSELRLLDPERLRLSAPLALPQGVAGDPAVGTGNRLSFPFTSPTTPLVRAGYLLDQDRCVLEEPPDLAGLTAADLTAAQAATFPGPGGPIEALVLAPSPPRRRGLLAVALHGGPVGQWSAAFTPELQLLAGTGAVVVAPNQRGSFGYGQAFLQALQGRAGAADLEDVTAVLTAAQAAHRPARTVLYGHSYGAYLALLVAATHPELCDGVVAVAPFTSLPALRADGGPRVRRLVDLLHDPAAGDADLLRRAQDLRARVLLVHGAGDDVIPAAHSRTLAERLRACGYQDGRDLHLLLLPGEGHEITGRAAVLDLYRHIERFMAGTVAAPAVGARRGQAAHHPAAAPAAARPGRK